MFDLLRFSTSIWTVLASSVILVRGALTVRERVRHHGQLPLASAAIKINSRIYSVASLYFCFIIALSSDIVPERLRLRFACETENTSGDTFQRHLYHFSKLYEYLDIFFVLANGGSVGLHFAFHHLTTPYLTYVRFLHNEAGWRLFAGLNTLHHFFMYAYFGGVAIFRYVLPLTGCLQHVLGIAGELYIIWANASNIEGVLWPNMASAGLLATYLSLYIKELQEKL